jgi:hypothetical protein
MTSNGTQPFQYAADAGLQLRVDTVTAIEPLITQGQQHTTSHLGLAEMSTVLQTLYNDGSVGARSWGLNAGSRSILFPRDGSLVLGGFDDASVDGRFYQYDIAKPANYILGSRPCPLQVTVTNLTLMVQGGSPVPLIEPSAKQRFCVEP